MNFKKIIIKNFQPFGDSEQTISLDSKDITLITGFNEITGSSNGSGKSSWIDALIWCLYGKTRGAADDICNKYTGKKNTKVQVDFVKDNDSYEVIRYRKHHEQGNKLYIFKNKKDISYDNNKDTQLALEAILKISYNAFISSLVFEKDNYTPFLSSTPTKRLEIIENILLDSGTISVYYEKVKQILKKAETAKTDIEEKIKEEKLKIKNIDTALDQYKESVSKKITECKKKITEYEEEKNKYSEINNLEEYKRKAKRKQELISSIKILKDNMTALTKQKPNIQTLFIELNKENKKLGELEEERSSLLENLGKGECPVCHQKTSGSIILEQINTKEVEIKEKQSDIETKTLEFDEANVKELQINQNIDEIIKELKPFEEELKKLEDFAFTLEELESLDKKVTDINNKIKTEQEKITNSIDKDYVEQQKQEKEKSNKNIEKNTSKLSILVKEMAHIQYFYDLFGNKKDGFKKYLINKILSVLNDKINQFLTIYFPYNITISFNQSLEEEIKVNDEIYSYKEFSSGEKMRLELSCVFALFFIIKVYLGVTSNILILDEILDLNLDSIGIKSTIGILNNLGQDGNSIFIISHKTDYNEHFLKRIKIIKERNNKSRIEYDEQYNT